MSGLTRREALGLAAVAGGAVLLGAPSAQAGVRETLPRIPVIRSRNGVLKAKLDAVAGAAPLDLS
ncbi:MAG: twin-arginine translocation signal domain-containing protein [Actinomycetota bacterium]